MRAASSDSVRLCVQRYAVTWPDSGTPRDYSTAVHARGACTFSVRCFTFVCVITSKLGGGHNIPRDVERSEVKIWTREFVEFCNSASLGITLHTTIPAAS